MLNVILSRITLITQKSYDTPRAYLTCYDLCHITLLTAMLFFRSPGLAHRLNEVARLPPYTIRESNFLGRRRTPYKTPIASVLLTPRVLRRSGRGMAGYIQFRGDGFDARGGQVQ